MDRKDIVGLTWIGLAMPLLLLQLGSFAPLVIESERRWSLYCGCIKGSRGCNGGLSLGVDRGIAKCEVEVSAWQEFCSACSLTHSLTGQGMTAGKRDPPAMLLLTAFHLPRLLSSYSTLAFRPFPLQLLPACCLSLYFNSIRRFAFLQSHSL
ncbi:uncharacterized protein BO66DRAFT_84463 [Aspergillus aculeatinus CBS 121060]|uniref:Uncharacterized protein n=1 Tax=Aspergillus aculeatinus CBS 121060 TaxID=1448322 RepID=A0ACD1HAL4_9EURO|nr:hypothetical protein BO66DRAFT_84463 [Aspergillus aculeatinus CBS 121060]RAH70622.1 hypothetical protein BO66DRAFT_84463 [Aspergillus aculeatinus CBS 121060]